MNRRRFLGATLGSLAFATTSGSHLALAEPWPRTEADIEGPFFLPNAPTRDRLTDDPTLYVRGNVTDTGGRPMRDAVIEVWQADAMGEYDRRGMRFRGTLRTTATGAYSIATVRPGHYRAGGVYRPSHIHVKVHANGRPSLTTQLYFPGDPYNDSDPWMRSSLLLRFRPRGCCSPSPTPAGRFDFVV